MVNHSRWLEAREHKFFNKLLQWNSILQPNRNRDSETVQHRTHRRPFFRHINEDLSHCLISIFPSTEEYDLAIDLCFLRIASTFGWQRSFFYNLGKCTFEVSVRRSLHPLLNFIQ